MMITTMDKRLQASIDTDVTLAKIPIQDNWRSMSIGHRIWGVQSMFKEMTCERNRRGILKRVHDRIRYGWFRDLDRVWPEFKRGV